MLERIGQDKPLSERVADEVIRYILDNRLSEGDRLPNETELAEALHVGRSTIREAMKRLATRNVVSIQRGRGTFIKARPGLISDPLGFRFAQDKRKLLIDLIELRLILEPPIAALASIRRTDADILRIREAQALVQRMVDAGQNHGAADAGFHAAIAQASQNSVISTMIPILNQSVDLVVSISGRASLDRTMQYHRDICEAISRGDARLAEAVMRSHLNDHREFVFQAFGDRQAPTAEAAPRYG